MTTTTTVTTITTTTTTTTTTVTTITTTTTTTTTTVTSTTTTATTTTTTVTTTTTTATTTTTTVTTTTMFSAEYDISFDIVLDADFSSLNETELTPLVEAWLKGAFPNSNLTVVGYRDGSIIADVEGTAVIDMASEPSDFDAAESVIDGILDAHKNATGAVGGRPIQNVSPARVTGGAVGTTTTTTTEYTVPDSDSDDVPSWVIPVGVGVGVGVPAIIGAIYAYRTN